uniref:Skp1_POZ domain-containing protein n=1 Tax=Panagrellus redivivus TaxID=6233 RepID=A0A7E4W8B5_PANRE
MTSSIGNLPETLKIRTLDNQVIEVTGKLINESEALKNAFEMHEDPEVGEMPVPVESSALMMALEFLEFFDLEEPHYPEFEREVFLEANRPAMKFLAGLPDSDKARMTHVIDYLECGRLIDCVMVYILNNVNKISSSTHKVRRQFFGDCKSYTEEDEEEIIKMHEEVQVPVEAGTESNSINECCTAVEEDLWEIN